MTPRELRDAICALVSEHVALPEDDLAPLRLESFALVVLAEDLEQRFNFRVLASEVVPAHFGSLAALIGYVSRKRAQP